MPYADSMRLSGYSLPDAPNVAATVSVGAALFADISDDERDELLEYLAWYRTRRRRLRAPSPA